MCEDFTPNFGDRRTGCCVTTAHHLTLPFFTNNNMIVVPHPLYFSLFHRLKIRLKGRHFYTTEVTEAESQAMLNTLTENDFRDAFKKWQRCWEWCMHSEGDYFDGDGGQYARN
jgi:hypothetical protein